VQAREETSLNQHTTPMTRPTNEEIPLLDDDEAMEAIATLRARGYSPEQVRRAMEHQTVPTTMVQMG
jgi:hypothetical protein